MTGSLKDRRRQIGTRRIPGAIVALGAAFLAALLGSLAWGIYEMIGFRPG